MSGELGEVIRAMKRLDKSDTKLARGRGRSALRAALRRFQKVMLEKYPTLDNDGKRRLVKKSGWKNCPVCNAPFSCSKGLIDHMARKHKVMFGLRNVYRRKMVQGQIVRVHEDQPNCFCGKKLSNYAGLVRRMEAEGWKEHLLIHQLKGMPSAI